MTLYKTNAPNFKFTLRGTMFKYIEGDGLYLSSSNNFFNLCTLDLYSNIRLTSAYNAPFRGTPIKDFVIVDETTIEFKLPEDIQPSTYDVIFCNPAGYYKTSTNKKLSTITILNK